MLVNRIKNLKKKSYQKIMAFHRRHLSSLMKKNKRIGVLNTSEKTKKEQFIDIKAFLNTIVSDKKLDDINSFVIIKLTNQFPLPSNDDEVDVTIYNGIVKDFKYE